MKGQIRCSSPGSTIGKKVCAEVRRRVPLQMADCRGQTGEGEAMSRATEQELKALAQDLVKAADSVRDAVLSVGLTYNLITVALAELLIEKNLATRSDIEDAMTRGFDGLDSRDLEDARRTLVEILDLLDRRRHRAN